MSAKCLRTLTFIVSCLDIQIQDWAHITSQSLFFSPELWRYLDIFTTIMRRRLPGYCSEFAREESAVFVFVFPAPSGQPGPMSTSLVNKVVKSIWKAAGVKKKLSVTDLRKATATLD